MPACPDRISQAPSDPFDSRRGPLSPASCLLSSSTVGAQPEQRPVTYVPSILICNFSPLTAPAGGLGPVNPISHPLFIGWIGAKEGADFRVGSLPLGLRFVRSSLEAFNLALLGPTALIDWVHKPSIIKEVSIFHGLPAYFSAIEGTW